MLKKLLLTLLGVSIFVTVCLAGYAVLLKYKNTTEENKVEPTLLKIGAILPLTGDNASYGVECQKGMMLALEEYNTNNIGQVSIIFEDTQADPKTAVTSVNKLRLPT